MPQSPRKKLARTPVTGDKAVFINQSTCLERS